MPLRLVFFGTPAFAVPTLERLIASTHPVVGVVTQPDRPRGRGHAVTPEAVKRAAVAHGIPVWQPDRLNDTAWIDRLRHASPDLGVVAAYGKLLPETILNLPRLGMINVHASLLPRWRGAAPVHRAVLAGDALTGVTIMRVVRALDAGPMLARSETRIDPDETSAELEPRLARLGAALLVDTVDRLDEGPLPEEAQDEREATYAARLQRHESQVDWARPARVVHNQIRGLQPWPLAAALLHGRRVIFLRSTVRDEPTDAPPGTVVAVDPDAVSVATRPGVVRVLALQLEGRKPMAARDFLNGVRVVPGDRFEPLPGLDA